MKATNDFSTEADLVAAFCADLAKARGAPEWTAYHETAGFDLLLVENKTGVQVGVEAKLVFNLKVLEQALPSYKWETEGPDYRAVLVPRGKVQHHLTEIARRLGVGIIGFEESRWGFQGFYLPDEENEYAHRDWYPWLPEKRCALPDYIPDVVGGHAAPVKLTHWKIKAIKLCVLLDRKGFVTRGDMKAIGISPSFWTQPGGYLKPGDGGYIRYERTPDLRGQHPRSYAEIEADFPKWGEPWEKADALAASITARISVPHP